MLGLDHTFVDGVEDSLEASIDIDVELPEYIVQMALNSLMADKEGLGDFSI